MPLPMVHLAVAMQVYPSRKTLPSPAFLLGSIAPDAIHIRRDTRTEDKHYVHLRKAADQVKLSHVQKLLRRYRNDESETIDFAEGYVVHILTDMAWFSTIYESFRSSLPDGLSHIERRTLYYQETDQIDFNLYAQMPRRSELWELLKIARPIDFDSLLTAEEIRGWQQRVLHWFTEIKEEPKIQPKHITDEIVQRFITEAVQVIIAWFTNWKTDPATSGKSHHYLPKNIPIPGSVVNPLIVK